MENRFFFSVLKLLVFLFDMIFCQKPKKRALASINLNVLFNASKYILILQNIHITISAKKDGQLHIYIY